MIYNIICKYILFSLFRPLKQSRFVNNSPFIHRLFNPQPCTVLLLCNFQSHFPSSRRLFPYRRVLFQYHPRSSWFWLLRVRLSILLFFFMVLKIFFALYVISSSLFFFLLRIFHGRVSLCSLTKVLLRNFFFFQKAKICISSVFLDGQKFITLLGYSIL